MTARDRIIAAALQRCYAEARRQGMSASQAEDEAMMVADFIKRVMA